LFLPQIITFISIIDRYNDLTKRLRSNVLGAVDELIRNFDVEFGSSTHHDTADHQIRRSYAMSDEDDSSCGSSFNQVNGQQRFLWAEFLKFHKMFVYLFDGV
jgi:hypothetical protein